MPTAPHDPLGEPTFGESDYLRPVTNGAPEIPVGHPGPGAGPQHFERRLSVRQTMWAIMLSSLALWFGLYWGLVYLFTAVDHLIDGILQLGLPT